MYSGEWVGESESPYRIKGLMFHHRESTQAKSSDRNFLLCRISKCSLADSSETRRLIHLHERI